MFFSLPSSTLHPPFFHLVFLDAPPPSMLCSSFLPFPLLSLLHLHYDHIIPNRLTLRLVAGRVLGLDDGDVVERVEVGVPPRSGRRVFLHPHAVRTVPEYSAVAVVAHVCVFGGARVGRGAQGSRFTAEECCAGIHVIRCHRICLILTNNFN